MGYQRFGARRVSTVSHPRDICALVLSNPDYVIDALTT